MPEDRTRTDVLALITDDPRLARAVPRLPPEILHAAIAQCGLQDCGELLALASPEQLAAVFDLDLWTVHRPGGEEEFDAARFCEWLEVLVDVGPPVAAAHVAAADADLVVAGLSHNVRVFDAAVFSPAAEPSGADVFTNAGREHGLHAEIGGFIVVARRTEVWDAIVEVLLALDEQHPDALQRVLRGCRRLTNSGHELDGLDDLLPDPEQLRVDLSLRRESRREQRGFLPPQQARAFLDSARRIHDTAGPPSRHPLFAAYQRALSESEAETPAADGVGMHVESPGAPSAVAGVFEVLREAGVTADIPRALPPGVHEPPTTNAELNSYLLRCAEADDGAWLLRNQELVFVANALAAGCSLQGRPLTRREAMDAAAATCNLGLVYWPRPWAAYSTHDLVTVFQVGWTTLHREVSMVAAARLLQTLEHVRSSERDVRFALHVLGRELRKQRQAGTPWRARERLEVLAPLDLPGWAALSALFDECPVMLANVSMEGGRRPHAVDPAKFQFIGDARHVAAVHRFLDSLTELYTT